MAGATTSAACACHWLRRDLATDTHKHIHDRIDPERRGNTRIVCAHCDSVVAGNVRADSAYVVTCTWKRDGAYLGTFTVGPAVAACRPS
jgi:hypothetical protein